MGDGLSLGELFSAIHMLPLSPSLPLSASPPHLPQVYEMYAVRGAGLSTSLAVPPLLAVFYAVLGALVVAADRLLPGPGTDAAQVCIPRTFVAAAFGCLVVACHPQQLFTSDSAQARSRDPRFVAAAFGMLAADLQLSATLFSGNVPFTQISVALALASTATWSVFDGTKQGLALGAVCAVGAPLAELLLLHWVPLWSYPQADMDLGEWGSFVSWVPW